MTHDFIRQYAAESARTIAALADLAPVIDRVACTISDAVLSGHLLLTAGNGGSAAEAMHLAEELTGKYCRPRRALPALCLNADPTALTCIANDWDFASVFSRQLEAFARPGAVFVGFSTSGNSENILRALATAKARGATAIGLLGKTGGKAKDLCDIALIVPSQHANHVQEAHQAILHLILEHIDSLLPNA